MTSVLIQIAIGLAAVLGLIFGGKKWGQQSEKRKQAEQVAKDRKRDAEVSSKPFVDNPFGRMRGPKG